MTTHPEANQEGGASGGESSTGLNPRVAGALAYSGWWVTGAIVWFVERRDRYVRFHAAQALAAFGVIALLVVLFAGLAAASITFMPEAFTILIAAAAFTWAVGVGLWLVAMWKAAMGQLWRIPIAARLADRLA